MTLQLETLETRSLPAITFLNSVLVVEGTNQADVVDIYQGLDPTQLVVNDNGLEQIFQTAAVRKIFIYGGNGNDVLTVQAPAIPAELYGGNGNDSLWTFGSDFLFGENGNDTLYSIVGASLINGGAGFDKLIGNVNSIFDNNQGETRIIFGQAQNFPVQLINGVLYFQGTANADSAQITEQFGKLFVIYNGAAFTFDAKTVQAVAGVFGAGADFVSNQSSIDAVFYGAAGNDTLLGGSGNDVLKGGADNDLLAGNNGRDDLTGDPGADTLMGGNAPDILRIDLSDTFFAQTADLTIRRTQQR